MVGVKTIENIRNCTQEEIINLVNYLQSTPVASIADLIQNGSLHVKIGIITSIEYLGTLKTEFGKIGIKKSHNLYNRNKFLVKEIYPMISKDASLDTKMLNSIKYFMEKFNQNEETKYAITILNNNSDYTIKDGNKRIVALYESKFRNQNNINLEVFVVSYNN